MVFNNKVFAVSHAGAIKRNYFFVPEMMKKQSLKNRKMYGVCSWNGIEDMAVVKD